MKRIKGSVERIDSVSMDGRTLRLILKITEGPDSLLDRRLEAQLNPVDTAEILRLITLKGAAKGVESRLEVFP